MRSGRFKRLAFVLMLGGLATAVLRKQNHAVIAASSVPRGQTLADVAMPQSAFGTPRAYKAAAIGAVIALVVLAASGWYAGQQQAEARATAIALTHGDPGHAPSLLTRYGCGGCHTIPGAPGADGKVGPDLAGLRQRVYVGGVLRNTPANLISWIVDPQRFSPRSAMPATGITETEARDVAAYLYTR